MPDLEFDDVTIAYGSRARGDGRTVAAVSHVSLSLPAGGTLGIAGESGSGKSTIAMSALRLLPKSATISGRILLGGTDVSTLSFGRLRAVRWAEASVVFQGAMHALNPVRSIGWQIVEALELHVSDRWRTAEARQERMRDLLAQVDVPAEKAESYPHELSGGQKQRVMIAMALACEPDIVIADEPTTALDVIVQAQVLAVLKSLISERGISLLMISHDLSVLADVCDRIAVMRGGELIEVGPSAQICTDGREPYTRHLAGAFPRIGDPGSRLRPQTARAELLAEPERERLGGGEVVVDVTDLSVDFRARGTTVHAVRGVSLACRENTITALVGQSGSGKTTLARTLLGLQVPTSGEVRYRGEPIPRSLRGLREYRSRVQMVFQDPAAALNPKLSVYESVAEGLRVHKFAGDEAAAVRAALEACELSPADTYLDALPHELSGGQRQRVVIAGALVMEPSVLVADEPVASLDASVRGEVLALLLSLKRRYRMASVVITHDLGLAWNVADEVAVMLHGRIVEHGSVEQVLLDPSHEYTKQLLSAMPHLPERIGGPAL